MTLEYIKWDETVEVVIIGSGFAGLAAAIEAKNGGASVIILEKMEAPGGNSIISDGGVAAAGIKIQAREGIVDSPAKMYTDMLKAGLGLNHPELVRVVTENSAAVFQRTIDDLGVKYLDRVDDHFGKPILAKAGQVNHPPFYRMRLWPKVHHAMGGVQINAKAEVIDLTQKPIRGFYAAGEVTGGVHGACRLGSCAITDCLVFGRIAGRNAAAER